MQQCGKDGKFGAAVARHARHVAKVSHAAPVKCGQSGMYASEPTSFATTDLRRSQKAPFARAVRALNALPRSARAGADSRSPQVGGHPATSGGDALASCCSGTAVRRRGCRASRTLKKHPPSAWAVPTTVIYEHCRRVVEVGRCEQLLNARAVQLAGTGAKHTPRSSPNRPASQHAGSSHSRAWSARPSVVKLVELSLTAASTAAGP
eukprot:365087-Chlamydomonas_euryale.AAC.9